MDRTRTISRNPEALLPQKGMWINHRPDSEQAIDSRVNETSGWSRVNVSIRECNWLVIRAPLIQDWPKDRTALLGLAQPKTERGVLSYVMKRAHFPRKSSFSSQCAYVVRTEYNSTCMSSQSHLELTRSRLHLSHNLPSIYLTMKSILGGLFILLFKWNNLFLNQTMSIVKAENASSFSIEIYFYIFHFPFIEPLRWFNKCSVELLAQRHFSASHSLEQSATSPSMVHFLLFNFCLDFVLVVCFENVDNNHISGIMLIIYFT